MGEVFALGREIISNTDSHIMALFRFVGCEVYTNALVLVSEVHLLWPASLSASLIDTES